MGKKSSVDELNKLLAGELSAVETYQMALDRLDTNSPLRVEIDACMRSHQSRAMMLRDQVVALGGQPVHGSGPWGTFAKAVEGTAKVFGEKAAIAALEEGEDRGLATYRHELGDAELDAQSRMILLNQLLPAQQETHARVIQLKKHL